MMERPNATVLQVDEAVEDFKRALKSKLDERDYGVFVSSHEILGVVEEERHELADAVRRDDLDDIADELLDVMVAAFWGYVSVKAGQLDWPQPKANYAAEYDS
jgi:hypothetical protein